jgi:hypothetical protein
MAESVTSSARRAAMEDFLRERGADTLAHPGGTLLAHLRRVADLLARWGADADVQAAGLGHAVYGTDGFDHPLVDWTDRGVVAALAGGRAEAVIYLYGGCDRAATYPRLGNQPALFRDRFSGREYVAEDRELRAFCEITVANELDVMAHNADLAVEARPSLRHFVARTLDFLSPPARHACQAELG